MVPKLKRIYVPIALFFFVLVLYIHNLSHAVTGGDVGDFISAASVGGVPHAPGYPLFTFLGFLLTRIQFISPAFMVGLVSVISSSIAVAFFYIFSFKLTNNKFIALISSLILSFNYLFWFYSEIAEVFALNNFFTIILFLFSFLYYKTKDDKFLYFLAFFTGLSLTNHQMIVLIFPSIFILIFTNLKTHIKDPRKMVLSLLLLLLGFSIYVYIPIASHFNPPINWDNVVDIKSFLHLLLRQDYGTFSSGSPTLVNAQQRLIIFKTYLFDLIFQLTIPVVLISILGAFELFKKDKKLLISILLAFLISGPLFVTYTGFPLQTDFYLGVYERFFIMSSVILLMLFPAGLLFFVNFLNKLMRKNSFNNLFIGIFLLIPLSLFYYNFPKTDLHNIYIGDRLAYDFLTSLPKNAVFFMSGDTPLFNLWYAKYSLKYRQDVTIVNINGLSEDSFIKKESDSYLKLYPKYKSNPDLINYVIRYIAKTRPVFSFIAMQPSTGIKNVWIPYGLEYEFLPSNQDIPTKNNYMQQTNIILSTFNKPGQAELNSIALGSYSLADISSVYAIAYLKIGTFIYSQYSDSNLALTFFNKAVQADPNVYQDYDVLGLYNLEVKKDCQKAEQNFNKAKDVYPFDSISYYLLYVTYKECSNNVKMQNRIVSEYNKTFQSNFFSDLKNNKAKSTLNY